MPAGETTGAEGRALDPTLDCLCTTVRSANRDSFATRRPNPRCPVHSAATSTAETTGAQAPTLREQIAAMVWDSHGWNDSGDGVERISWADVLQGASHGDQGYEDDAFRCRHAADRILAALRSPETQEREPVAWRIEGRSGAGSPYVWFTEDAKKAACASVRPQLWTVTPLYAAAPHQGDREVHDG